MKKIKDLDPTTNLGGIKVKTKEGKIGFWKSQWHKGVWLSSNKTVGGQIFPQFLEDINEILEWEVIEDEEIKTNL